MSKFLEILIYTWPWSQICMSCRRGEFVDSQTFDASCYICWECCKENDGSVCPKFEKDV